ncbi:MAG: rod-binding protein [Acidaminobacteraceae bacterium]
MDSVSLNNNGSTVNTQIESNRSDAIRRKLESAKDSNNDAELRDAAEQFESVFINMMLKTMRSTIPENQGYIEKSNASSTYESMLDEEMSKGMSKGGGFGLSDMIYKSLAKRVEMEDAARNSDVKDVDVKEKNEVVKVNSEEI